MFCFEVVFGSCFITFVVQECCSDDTFVARVISLGVKVELSEQLSLFPSTA